MQRKWKVGVMGLGHWYSGYGLARGLQEYPKAELVAVASRDEGKAKEFASTFGIDAYTDYDRFLERKDLDIVHIAPPVIEIPECCIKAARAGKHMILGKPMAMTAAAADEMVAEVKKAGIKCVCFQGMQKLMGAGLKRRIDSGIIGDIILMHATGRWGIAEDWFHSGQSGWFTDPKQVPGGALIDEGIYSVEQMRWLAGCEVVQVEAKVANLVHKELGVEDWGMATFTFANGIIGTLEAAWTIVTPRRTGPSPKHNSNRRMEIIGTAGEIVQDGLHNETCVLGKGADTWVFERPGGDQAAPTMPGQLVHLIDCIENGKDTPASIEEARKTFITSLAAYDAARTGAPVKLTW